MADASSSSRAEDLIKVKCHYLQPTFYCFLRGGGGSFGRFSWVLGFWTVVDGLDSFGASGGTPPPARRGGGGGMLGLAVGDVAEGEWSAVNAFD